MIYPSGKLKTQIGQYAAGQYGLYVMGGQVYSTIFQTGAPTDTAYVAMIPPNMFKAVFNGLPCVEITAGGAVGNISVFDAGTEYARVTGAYQIGSVLHGGFFSVNGRPIALIGPNGNNITLNADGSISLNSIGNVVVTLPSGKNFYCTGGGVKNVLQDTKDYGSRFLCTREGPDVRFVIEGVASLVDGEAKIALDPVFLECIEPNTPATSWLVQLTPYAASMGLFVAEIGDSFIAVKSDSGTGSGDFAWSLSAIRNGCAGIWLKPLDDQKE